ncbi:MAG: peptidoglycan-binding domain-containing protein, partial [Acidimicrobiales bacterium]
PEASGPPPAPGEGATGRFDDPTEEAVRAFQRQRGLRVDGVCGPQTWGALVEAGYRPGDRLLYLRQPKLRGDDVAELQRQLSSLGFDAGRVDGIFGDRAAVALADFQRNVAIPVDGICGRTTWEELGRLLRHSDSRSLVAGVREREELRRAPRTLAGRRVAIGHPGGLGAAVEAVRRAVVEAGADAVALLHPDGSQLATQANLAEVDVYLGLRLQPDLACSQIAYYRGYRYESAGGRRLAELICEHLAELVGDDGATALGMSVPELRYSRMPAVVCEVATPALVVEQAADLSRCLLQAMATWVLAWE